MKIVAKTLPRIVETATFPGQDPAFSHFGSFPLNRPSGLGGQVKHYAVDAVNLMRDAGGDVVEKRIGDLFDGGRHGVGGVDARMMAGQPS